MLRFRQIKSVAAAKDYFKKQLALGDYYIQHAGRKRPEEMIGQWGGKVAERLELEGQVSEEAFYAVMDNKHPETGERLTLRQNKDRRPGWDVTICWPNSASELYAMIGDERIMEGALRAMRRTMEQGIQHDLGVRLRGSQAETDLAEGNVEIFQCRKGGSSAKTGAGIWAEFTHLTGRPVFDPKRGISYPDFGVHHHVVLANVTYNPWYRNRDGSYGAYMAVDAGEAKARARLHEASFHVEFANEMAALGYGIEAQPNGYWEVAGWSREHIEKFSRRQSEVQAAAKKLGLEDADDISNLAAKTRKGKDHGLSWTELQEIWHDVLSEDEYNHLIKAKHGAIGERWVSRDSVKDVLAWTIDHAFENDSAVTMDKFREDVYRRGFGIAGKDDFDLAIRELLEGEGDNDLASAVIEGKEMVTSRRVAKQEQWMIDFARNSRNSCTALGPRDYVTQTALFKDESKDTREQERAVRKILRSTDRVMDLRGGAGTGKTTLMQEAVAGILAGIDAAGHEVHVFAPTAEASRKVLREEGFTKADTVASLLTNAETQDAIKGGVLWIDEAGLLGTVTMAHIFRLAEEHDCRVVLSGDRRQHKSVPRGDALAMLEDRGAVEVIELNTIRRQRRNDYRQAVGKIAQGDVAGAVTDFDRMGAIVEISDRQERNKAIAAGYVEVVTSKKGGKPRTALVVSPTHKDGDAVTKDIRTELRQAGLLEGEDREYARLVNQHMTEARRGLASSYSLGLVVQFHRGAAADEPVNGRPFFNAGGQFKVVGKHDGHLFVEDHDGVVKELPLEHADRFSVHTTQSIQLAVGDKLKVTRNNAQLGLYNGQIVDVAGFTAAGNISLTNGTELPADFGNLAHGYVSTSHSSQGRTVDEVFIAQGTDSSLAVSKEQFYVSASRGRDGIHIYTDDREEMLEQVSRSTRRVAALEVLEAKKARQQKLQEANQQRLIQAVQRAQKLADMGQDPGVGMERYIDREPMRKQPVRVDGK